MLSALAAAPEGAYAIDGSDMTIEAMMRLLQNRTHAVPVAAGHERPSSRAPSRWPPPAAARCRPTRRSSTEPAPRVRLLRPRTSVGAAVWYVLGYARGSSGGSAFYYAARKSSPWTTWRDSRSDPARGVGFVCVSVSCLECAHQGPLVLELDASTIAAEGKAAARAATDATADAAVLEHALAAAVRCVRQFVNAPTPRPRHARQQRRCTARAGVCPRAPRSAASVSVRSSSPIVESVTVAAVTAAAAVAVVARSATTFFLWHAPPPSTGPRHLRARSSGRQGRSEERGLHAHEERDHVSALAVHDRGR